MLLLLHGPDTFRSRQCLKEMVAEFKTKRDSQGLNVVFFDAKKSEGGEMVEALLTPPFLSERRMVIIENLSVVKSDEMRDLLLELAKEKKIPESTVAIFWEEESFVIPAMPTGRQAKSLSSTRSGAGIQKDKKKVHPLFAFLAQQKYSKEFKPLGDSQLIKWVENELKKSGIKIEKRALEHLVASAGADLWQLNSELGKLAAFAGSKEDKTITFGDISLFVSENIDDNVFHLIDALLGRRAKEAIKLLQDQWEAGEERAKIFGAIIWQFRSLLIIKDYLALNPGVGSDQISRALGLHPFVIKKALAILPGFNFEQLKKIYQKLLEIDLKVKTGGGDLLELLELLVAEICL